MDIKGSVAVVTGANRGIGRAFARALLEHGAAKVYGGARDPEKVTDPGVTPLRLDVTRPDDVAAAAAIAADATIVINNAGTGDQAGLLDGDFAGPRQTMEVNFFGTWAVSQAFAPILARNGGGALVNMLSVASWAGTSVPPGYSASKAAQWSLTGALRQQLRDQGTLVVGVHCGFVDTDLTAWLDGPKISAADVAEQTMLALSNDWSEVLADEWTKRVKASLSQSLNG